MTSSRNHKTIILSIIFLFVFPNVSIWGNSQKKIKITIESRSCVHCDCSFFLKDSIIYNSQSDTEGFLIVPESILNIYTGFEIRLGNFQKCYLTRDNIDLSKDINCDSCDIEDITKAFNLNEIVVYGKTTIVEDNGYKITYNAGKDLKSNAVTTTDLLRKTPMISVDISGTPSIKGDQNIRILVNNREISGLLPAQIIEQIPSGDVEKIEVITSPGAKYDAEGTSGIINIITRKNIYFKSSFYTNTGIGTKGSHLFANYSYNFNNKWSVLNSFNNLTSYSKTKGKQMIYNSEREKDIAQRESDGKNNGNLYSYQLTLSKVSEKDNFNVYVNYYMQKLKHDELFKTHENQTNESYTKNEYSFYRIAADYTRKLSDILRIDISSAGFYLPLHNKMNLNDIENRYNYSIANNINYFDMEILLSKKIFFNLGSKYAFNLFKNKHQQTNGSAWQMNFATYLDATYKITTKLIFNSGIRYENYILKGLSDIDKNYNDLFFNGNINYKIDNKTTVSFLYSKRTQRASYAELLPIENYTSSNLISVGNPNLNREISYNYEIGFSKYIGEQFIKIAPFYKQINNKISNFISSEKNFFYTNHINLDNEKDFGISLWMSLNFLKRRFNIDYGFDVVNKYLKYNKLQSKGMRFLNNLNMTYKIMDDFHINLFGSFNTPNIYLQGNENSYTYSNLSLQKNFHEGKLRIAVSLDNPFNKGITLKQKYLIGNYTYDNQLIYYNRGIRVFIIYKFGKKQSDSMTRMQNDILKEQNN
jgi:outer membrane cobalamin receptor